MKKRIDTTRKAAISVVCGSSGCGKSWWVKEQIKAASRLIIWDVDDEYDDLKSCVRVTSAVELLDWLHRYPRGALRIRLVSQGQKAFDVFCRAAFAWANCTVVAEEIAGVTSPSKAPAGWHTLISRGRKRGITLFGVTQRPSESDKTIMGSASLLHVGRLSRAADRRYMAAELDCEVSLMAGMRDLNWLERVMSTGQLYAGTMGKRGRELIESPLTGQLDNTVKTANSANLKD